MKINALQWLRSLSILISRNHVLTASVLSCGKALNNFMFSQILVKESKFFFFLSFLYTKWLKQLATRSLVSHLILWFVLNTAGFSKNLGQRKLNSSLSVKWICDAMNIILLEILESYLRNQLQLGNALTLGWIRQFSLVSWNY